MITLENKLWPEQRFSVTKNMKNMLADSNLVIADIGAAGGVGARWGPLKYSVKFICFEADQRSLGSIAGENMICFPTGLGEKKAKKTLFLTAFPDASSTYPFNLSRLNDYANYKSHEVTGSAQIEADTLDNCLSKHPGLRLDFIKVDVEGADLEVLKGATASLRTVKGIQVEVSFIERHVGAPFFGDIDAFLHQYGFELFILKREHWLRRNLLYGVNSSPQIIWADAVYFLTKETFLKRLSQQSDSEKEADFVKFIIILLAYGAHDYAMELVDAAAQAKIVPAETIADVRKAVKASVANPFLSFLSCIFSVLFGFLMYLVSLPIRPVREIAYKFLKKRLLFLSRWLYHITRSGLYNSFLHD